MDVEETALPGVGLRHDLLLRGGRRLGVVSQVNGDRELVLYDEQDPDASHEVVHLSPQEAATLAELLGAPRVVERLARLREQVQGIATEGIVLPPESPFATSTLGDTAMRTRTGVSVVAVIRDSDVTASPQPAFPFRPGDRLIVVGTHEGVEAARRLLSQG